MAQVNWTIAALDSLDAIAEYIAADSEQYASLLVLDILRATRQLEDFPLSGKVLRELDDPAFRELLRGNYRIIYRVANESVDILTIYHGSRILDPTNVQ